MTRSKISSTVHSHRSRPAAAPSPLSLHQRDRRRRQRIRLSAMGSAVLAIVVVAVVLVAGPATSPASAVTLYPGSAGSVAAAQLPADQRVMTARLHAIGYPNAKVTVAKGALVVTSGPTELADPSSLLLSSPELLVRQVRCFSKVASGPRSTNELPSTCSNPKYAAPTSTPDGTSSTSGFTVPNVLPDPALSAYATTTPTRDAASPNTSALLPFLNSGKGVTQRYLVGPTLLTLSSRVASAKVTRAAIAGGWLVEIRLNRGESILWDRVAKTYFHRQLAIDLNGVVVDAPIIEPGNTTFSSFDGQMELLATTKSRAYDLAAALKSGPLAVPLTDQPGTNYFPPDHDLQFVSSDVGWIVANNNSIVGTTDGGREWSTSYRGSVTDVNNGAIENIDFVNASDGWALLLYRGLIATRDGGKTWSVLREPTQGSIMNYDFVTADVGWALTDKGELLVTHDGGVDWVKFPAPALGTSLCATPTGTLWLGVDGSGSLTSWTAGNGSCRSRARSHLRRRTPFHPNRLDPRRGFVTGNTAWLFYGYGEGAGSMPYAVERTVDSGRTWKVVTSSQVTPSVPRNTPGRFATIDDFGLTTSGDAWMTGYCGPCETGKAEVAIASGTAPSQRSLDVKQRANSLIHALPVGSSFINSMDGWVNLQENQNTATGDGVKNVIGATTDGGRTWHVVRSRFQGMNPEEAY